MNSAADIIKELKKYANPKNVEGMRRFGIITKDVVFGVDTPTKKLIAKKIRKSAKTPIERHKLAQELWDSKIHEARILSALVESPGLVTEKQMEDWVKDFDNWGLCDSVCGHLFDKTKFARRKIFQWVKNDKEFIRRAGFVMMATLAVHDKKAPDSDFIKFFPLIKKYSRDERNFVKKAVNWALRQIGKRNLVLRKRALVVAREIGKKDSKSARWVARDAIRELEKKN